MFCVDVPGGLRTILSAISTLALRAQVKIKEKDQDLVACLRLPLTIRLRQTKGEDF